MTKNNSLSEAYKHCRSITRNHYENFPVASFLIPQRLRNHVYAIYAFARHADDLSDERRDKSELLEWRELFHQSLQGKSQNPILFALSDTIQKFNLPISLLDRLIAAFLQDLDKNRYQDIEELYDYCHNSANPVGRIILHLNGHVDDNLFRFSDYICTALQLTNFWQDVRIDVGKNRIYIPQDYLVQHHVHETQIKKKIFDDNFKNLMCVLINLTNDLFKKGLPLIEKVQGRLKWELKFTLMGGLAILSKIKEINYNVLETRPILNKSDWTNITFNLMFKKNGMI